MVFGGFDSFMSKFKEARALFVGGMKGTGKTLFSVALSYEMLRLRYVAFTAFNFPVCKALSFPPVKNQCIATIDEAGVFFDARFTYRDKVLSAFVTESTSFLRKDGSFMIIPSYSVPDVRLRSDMRIHRLRALPFSWFYRWESGEEDVTLRKPGVNFYTGTLVLFNPAKFFGTYDTRGENRTDDD